MTTDRRTSHRDRTLSELDRNRLWSRILVRRNPPGAHPRSLRATVVEAVEHVREQWSLEVVEYDRAENNDESNDESNDPSLCSVMSEFSISGSKLRRPHLECFGCVVP